MRRAPLTVFAFIGAAFALPAFAATQWTRLSTPDFELYATSNEKPAREILRKFEEVHGFFLKASPVREGSADPVRVIEFNSDRMIQPYRVNNYSPAWFIGAPDHDYIVIDDAQQFDFAVAIHEYVHLIVRRSGLKLPIWLNEGWADVYSSLRPEGKSVAVGDLLDGRMHELDTNKWMSFEELTSVNHSSPEYNEASRAGIFYAESWALVHMLYLAPDYQQNFGKFVLAINQGKSAAEALGIAWGRTPDQVYSDLKKYFDRRKIYGRVFEAPLRAGASEPEVKVLNDFDSSLLLADLLVASGKPADAKRAYDALEATQPANPPLARSLGYLAVQQHDSEGARRWFGKAFDEGDADPRMCLRLAQMDEIARQPPARVIAELECSLRSDPDQPEARLELGVVQIEGRRFSEGIQTLVGLHTISAARAPAVYCGLTYARIETGDLETARANLETCRKYAGTAPQQSAAKALSLLLAGRSKPEAAVRPNEQLRSATGVAVNLDCSSEGNRLQVQIGNKIVNFDLPGPDAVELTKHSGMSFDFVCGRQKPFQVTVDFAPPRSAMETSAGVIRRMEF